MKGVTFHLNSVTAILREACSGSNHYRLLTTSNQKRIELWLILSVSQPIVRLQKIIIVEVGVMDKLFKLNPEATKLDLQDGIDERVMQIVGLAECLLVSHDLEKQLDYATLHNTLWLLRDKLEEVVFLRDAMLKRE